MKTKSLDGHLLDWTPKGTTWTKSAASTLHKSAKTILGDIFSSAQIKEEVPIPVKRNKTLYFDFYLPLYHLAIEVHGEQHFKYSQHFHGSRKAFLKSKRNDLDKLEWAKQNNIDLIILPYSEDKDEWSARIQKWRRGEDPNE